MFLSEIIVISLCLSSPLVWKGRACSSDGNRGSGPGDLESFFFHIFFIFYFLETSDHEILPGEGLQHRHLLLVRLLVCWEIHFL